jgi:acyl-CoA synthetase (AMP-forming)/AMP-acid ligase II
VFRSEYADVPAVELPIHEAVLGRAAAFGDAPALIDGTDGTTLTYEQLDRLHRRIAAALAEAGVRKGDVLALHSPNTVAFPAAFYAATRAGASVTTVHPLVTPEEFAKQLKDSAARWIVTVSPLLEAARRAAELAGGWVITCSGERFGKRGVRRGRGTKVSDCRTATSRQGRAGIPRPRRSAGAGGMTAVTSRSNVREPQPRWVGIPLHGGGGCQIYGLAARVNAPPRRGASVVLPRFDLETFLSAIQNHRITGLYVAPPIVLALAKHPLVTQYDLSILKYIVSAAAPLDAKLAAACSQRLGLPPVGQAYGMTELSPGGPVGPRVVRISTAVRGRPVTVGDARVALGGPAPTAGLAGSHVCGVGVRLLGGTPSLALTGAATDVEAEGPIREGRAPGRSRRGRGQQVQGLPRLFGRPVHGGTAKTKPLPWVRRGAPAVIPGAPRRRAPRACVPGGCRAAYVAERVAPYKRVRQVTFIDGVPRAASGKILRRALRALREDT